MKRLFYAVGILILASCSTANNTTPKKKQHITQSTNIKEIEAYLSTAHKDDQYRLFLKKKLVSLKNASWMKNDKASPIATPTLNADKAYHIQSDKVDRALFNKLMDEDKSSEKQTTAKILNDLFNEADPNSPTSVVLIQNKSLCDLILNMEGPQLYNLAVPANSDKSIIVKKGSYTLRSNICDAAYESLKSINKNIVISLNIEKDKTKS